MNAVKIAIAIALFLDLIWTIYWLLYLGLDGKQMNRRMKDAEHPSPDELRNRAVMVGQLALMGMVNVMAGALAGIGSSLFVAEGRLRWPSSQVPYTLIILAVSLTVFSGIIIATYITRPAHKWVWDTSDFRSYLRQIKREEMVSKNELAEIRKRRERWRKRTNVRPLRDPQELRTLGLELPKAHEEWILSVPNDPAEFGNLLCRDVTRKQVWRWIWRKRLWQLGLPPFIAGCTIALIIISRLSSLLPSLPLLFARLLLIALAVICIKSVYELAFRVGRLDLVMTNRYIALECKQLNDCDDLIGQIEVSHNAQQKDISLAGENGSSNKLEFRIGRWHLCRRSE